VPRSGGAVADLVFGNVVAASLDGVFDALDREVLGDE
jgi:hypothetical protein